MEKDNSTAVDFTRPDDITTAINAGKQIANGADRIVFIDGEDRGIAVTFPAAIIPGRDGSMSVITLADTAKAADAYAREKRLRDAAGPDRLKGTATMQSVASLVAHVNRFKDPDSAVWANPTKREIVAVLDYNRDPHQSHASASAAVADDSFARWGAHRSVYACPLSDAWLAWGSGKALVMGQEDFAKFLDAHDRDLTAERPALTPSDVKIPTPAQLITIAASLETYSGQKVKTERDGNGRRKLAFSTESGFTGDVVPPPAFAIQIPCFLDSKPEVMEVRLRPDVMKSGEAQFTIQIHASGDVLRDAFEELVKEVESSTSLPCFLGTPEA